jgi:hypothetical protein
MEMAAAVTTAAASFAHFLAPELARHVKKWMLTEISDSFPYPIARAACFCRRGTWGAGRMQVIMEKEECLPFAFILKLPENVAHVPVGGQGLALRECEDVEADGVSCDGSYRSIDCISKPS